MSLESSTWKCSPVHEKLHRWSASCLLICNYLGKDFRVHNAFMLALLSHSIDLVIVFRKYRWGFFSLKASIFFLQNIRFEDQMVFTVKSPKPNAHHDYCMTASLQHAAYSWSVQEKDLVSKFSLGGGHGSRLQYGQRDGSNWGGRRQAHGAGQCPQTPQECAGSQGQVNFF